MKTEITRIKLKLKDREVELTAQEARDVYEELAKLFAIAAVPLPCTMPPVVKEIHHHHPPIIIDRPTWPKFPDHYKWEIF